MLSTDHLEDLTNFLQARGWLDARHWVVTVGRAGHTLDEKHRPLNLSRALVLGGGQPDSP